MQWLLRRKQNTVWPRWGPGQDSTVRPDWISVWWGVDSKFHIPKINSIRVSFYWNDTFRKKIIRGRRIEDRNERATERMRRRDDRRKWPMQVKWRLHSSDPSPYASSQNVSSRHDTANDGIFFWVRLLICHFPENYVWEIIRIQIYTRSLTDNIDNKFL